MELGSGGLTRVAEGLLGEIDRLAAEQVLRIRGAQPAYASAADVADEDLLESCRTNLTGLIASLAGIPVAPDPLETARATGRRRATQGVPLEAVLRSFSLGGRAIWDGLLQRAGEDHAHELLGAAGAVWAVLDEYSIAVSQAYRETERRLHERDRREHQAALNALLSGAGGDPDRAAALARALDLRPGPLAVVVYEERGPRTPVELLQARGLHVDWTVRSDRRVALVAAGEHSSAALRDGLRGQVPGRVAVSPLAAGVADVAHALRAAELAWSTLPEGGDAVVLLEDRLVEAVVLASPGLAEHLVARVVQPLLDLGPEGAELLETVGEFLRLDGSAGAAARSLYVHRNTVHARIGRVERLCGVGLVSTRDRVLWSLALVASGRVTRHDDGAPC